MRTIKFRAWIRNELMSNVVSVDFNNEFITWDDNQFDRCVPPNKCYEIETFEDIELMQFTGLKDKNGKEIYEGDICDTRDEDLLVCYDYNEFIYMVLFSEDHSGVNGYTQKDLEIIGNIYENPEILINE
jgi:hypothetical protein